MLGERKALSAPARLFASYFLLTLFALSCFLWARDPRPEGLAIFPPPLTAGAIAWLGLPCAVFGPFAFAALEGSFAGFFSGLFQGVFMAALGFCAYHWIGF